MLLLSHATGIPVFRKEKDLDVLKRLSGTLYLNSQLKNNKNFYQKKPVSPDKII